MGIGDWGLGIGGWAQSPIPIYISISKIFKIKNKLKIRDKLIIKN